MKSIYQYICEMSEIEGFRSEVLAEVERLKFTEWAKKTPATSDYSSIVIQLIVNQQRVGSVKLPELLDKADRIERTQNLVNIIQAFAKDHNIKVHFDKNEEPESMANGDYSIFLAQEILKQL